VPLVGQLVAGGVSQHVRVDREGELRELAGAGNAIQLIQSHADPGLDWGRKSGTGERHIEHYILWYAGTHYGDDRLRRIEHGL
jgi:hypothetical protein